MELFLKRTKGSITVMVTLILVPTIFFTGFMTELARIKMYSNQALMTADNYGEAVLSDYDNLLKELYGLFAVSQNEKGKKALKALESYMATSFHPNENTVSWGYGEAVQERFGWNTRYEGFMPYRDAEVKVSYAPVEGATLTDERILMTQIGDFMRFRIAQQLLKKGDDGGDALFKAIDNVLNTKGEAEVIDAKSKLDEQAGKTMEAAKEYYEVLHKIAQYPAFIQNINNKHVEVQRDYKAITDSSSYQLYRYYEDHADEIAAAREHAANLEEGESLSSEEEELIRKGAEYDADPEARRNRLYNKFEQARKKYTDAGNSTPVDFNNYKTLVLGGGVDIGVFHIRGLVDEAENVKDKIETLQTLKNELDRKMAANTIDEDLRRGINKDLEDIDKLFGASSEYSADNYVNLAEAIKANNIEPVNVIEQHQGRYTVTNQVLESIRDDYLDGVGGAEYEKPLMEGGENPYYDFETMPSPDNPYNKLYISLKESFSGSGTSEGQKKKDEADNKLEEKQEALKGDEATSARDIPESLGLGEGDGEGNFALLNMINEAVSYFTLGSADQVANALLLKLYTVSYDFGMFSSRITNIEDGKKVEDDKQAVSLTGVKMGPEVNYLYGAELEYLLGGSNSSVKNLNLSRNRILAFRAVINMRATYKVTEIDTPIKALKEACNMINPVLGIAVAGALRLAVTGIETYGDWEELKKGNKVVLIKNELSDLTTYEEIKGLIGGTEGGTSGGSSDGKKLKLDYEQYLLVMAVFMTQREQVARRTGNLIMLNVNTVRKKLGADRSATLSSLDWKLSDAVTAVNATCSVHLNFVIIPEGFAQKMTSEEVYNEMQQFEKNTYQYTVTRGY